VVTDHVVNLVCQGLCSGRVVVTAAEALGRLSPEADPAAWNGD
jgi:hypothetical protein